jgi:hypothetical protein
MAKTSQVTGDSSIATSGRTAASQTGQLMHGDRNCQGFGKIIALPGVTRLLGVDLKAAGFHTRDEVVGLSNKLVFGSDGCEILNASMIVTAAPANNLTTSVTATIKSSTIPATTVPKASTSIISAIAVSTSSLKSTTTIQQSISPGGEPGGIVQALIKFLSRLFGPHG